MGATAANNFNQFLTAYIPGLEAIETVEAVTGGSDAENGLVGRSDQKPSRDYWRNWTKFCLV